MFTILCHGPPVSMLHLLAPSSSVNAWAAASTVARPDPLQRCVGTRHMPRRRTHGRVASGHHRDPGGDQQEFQHGLGLIREQGQTKVDKSHINLHSNSFIWANMNVQSCMRWGPWLHTNIWPCRSTAERLSSSFCYLISFGLSVYPSIGPSIYHYLCLSCACLFAVFLRRAPRL